MESALLHCSIIITLNKNYTTKCITYIKITMCGFDSCHTHSMLFQITRVKFGIFQYAGPRLEHFDRLYVKTRGNNVCEQDLPGF
jgi:hypothetical protein